jgi:two-component system sensor histidine kinase RegB
VRVETLVSELLRELSDADRVDVVLDGQTGRQSIDVPIQSLSQAVRGVLQNALDASPSGAPVEFSVGVEDQWLRFSVRDHGPGMSAEVMGRAGEPFFSTKEPGKGMGLGLFLTRSVVERLDGKLEITSPHEQGVTAKILLPLTVEAPGNSAGTG